MDKYDLIRASKKLSYLLRHDPEDLEMDIHGWVWVTDLLYKLKLSRTSLDEIVETNDKKRFAYNAAGTKIRASQGHSIDFVDIIYRKESPKGVLYHGTSPNNIDSIMKFGLMKMKRSHVHLSDNSHTARQVGERYSKDKDPVILEIDAPKMEMDGYSFFLSDNGVWLIDHVPQEYISVIELPPLPKTRQDDKTDKKMGIEKEIIKHLCDTVTSYSQRKDIQINYNEDDFVRLISIRVNDSNALSFINYIRKVVIDEYPEYVESTMYWPNIEDGTYDINVYLKSEKEMRSTKITKIKTGIKKTI